MASKSEHPPLSVEAIKAGLDCFGTWRHSSGSSAFKLTRGDDGSIDFRQDLPNGRSVLGKLYRSGSATPLPNCWTWHAELNNGAEARMKRHGPSMIISSRTSSSSAWAVPVFATRISKDEGEPVAAATASEELESAETASRKAWQVSGSRMAIAHNLAQIASEEDRSQKSFCLKWQASFPSKEVFNQKRISILKEALDGRGEADDKDAKDAAQAARGAIQHVPIPAGSDTMHPLSFNEDQMMSLYVSDPYNLSYNLGHLVQLPVMLDVKGVEQVIDIFTRRHVVFCSTYSYGKGKEPVRALHAKFPGTTLKLAASRASMVGKLAGLELAKPLQLGVTGSRFSIVPSSDGKAPPYIIANVHHIMADADSMAILQQELIAIALCLYAGYSEEEMNAELLPKLPVSFVDFAYWHQDLARKHALVQDMAWCYYNVVASTPPLVLDLPLDRPRPRTFVATGSGIRMQCPQELLAPMSEFGVTPFGAALAAWAMCLSRVTGREYLCVGIPFALRPQAALHNLIGNFLNMLPCRIRCDPLQNYNEYVRAVGAAAVGVQKHALAPFMSLVSNFQRHVPVQDPSRNPMYQTMVDMVPVLNPGSDEASGGLSGILDLFLFVGTYNGNVCCVDAIFNSMILQRQTVRTMLLQMRQIMYASARQPKAPLPLSIGCSREPVQVAKQPKQIDLATISAKSNGKTTAVKVQSGFSLAFEKTEANAEEVAVPGAAPASRFVAAAGLAHVGKGEVASTSSAGGAVGAVNPKEFRVSPDDGKAYKYAEYLEFFGDADLAKALWFRSKVVVDGNGAPREEVKRRRPNKKPRAVM
mmetsp:Transcript_31862/g.74486  ORF Transcript_31862/g.74486 Transcript_31862/m.74486 type:complete len:815 (-) Transcript_31862:80-2524(-)|eukprot:CAMPEP_0178424938 /NCGR_PEP_ID=MMETSP0689_2-20121128/28468_1 /TAXON_ID=160604 /ORGANISM="Amphidinium massartii, Strain CS-259" /LENGTH=814 /DNA_ID=CAMNT_0020046591 /DNA_START=17 /DNA_END=2461 /DNA_ORIENTATION=+